MYSHSRSFGGHSNNPPVSHYTHHTPPSSFHSGRNTSSSHLHVLQNPPHATGNNSNFMPQATGSSPSRNQQYQPYYPSPASISMNQELWNNGTILNGNENLGGNSNNNMMRPRPSANVATGNRNTSRAVEQASTPKSTTSSADARPNWGLISRQLSQIAGDVSTSVRQNELVITLLERLIERVDGGTAMQANTSARGQMGLQEEGGTARAASRLAPRRQQTQPQQQQQQQQSEYEVENQESSRGRGETNVRQSNTMLNHSHTQEDSGNASQSVPSYIDNDLTSSSFDFGGTSQNIPHRTQYPSTINHRFDADNPPKRTPPTVSFMLSGEVAPNHSSSTNSPAVHSFPALSNERQQHSSSHHNNQQQQHHHHHTRDELTSDNVPLEETYNCLPSPVFSDSALADHEPLPAALGLSQYYGTEEGRSSPTTHTTNPLNLHGMHLQPPAPAPTATERQDSRNRLTVMTSAGMGSLEDAGLIPISSNSSTSVTPAPKSKQVGGIEEIGDQSINTSVAYSAADGDQSQVEVANSDWKLWQTPKPPSKSLTIPSKYRSIRQVKNERKEKTKRSISTIGRIPLKEYLEVGSDYKAVRRMARTVYNTWLSLNVRLAKQDPDRLRACYHKLEYEYPILGDCEDHWKSKELMLQVIDNAIDEIAFHRRKEERKAQEPESTTTTNNNEVTNHRRDATAADLYTNEQDRPNTRRRRGNARDRSGDEVEVMYETGSQQNWDQSGESANLFAQSNSAVAHEQQQQQRQQQPARSRRTQQQMTAGWH